MRAALVLEDVLVSKEGRRRKGDWNVEKDQKRDHMHDDAVLVPEDRRREEREEKGRRKSRKRVEGIVHTSNDMEGAWS